MRKDYINIKVTPEEKAKIEANAKAEGLTVSAYLRRLGMKGGNK